MNKCEEEVEFGNFVFYTVDTGAQHNISILHAINTLAAFNLLSCQNNVLRIKSRISIIKNCEYNIQASTGRNLNARISIKIPR